MDAVNLSQQPKLFTEAGSKQTSAQEQANELKLQLFKCYPSCQAQHCITIPPPFKSEGIQEDQRVQGLPLCIPFTLKALKM